jgi:hypothetical protein
MDLSAAAQETARGWPARGAAPIVAAMPETPDLKALAERYLDLWEEQFAAAAADPALAAAMAAWLGPWRAMAAESAGRKSDDKAARPSSETRGRAPASAHAPAGTPAAGAASGDGGRGLERILEQLERIERRLDALERKRAGKGAGAGPRGGRARRPRDGG